MHTRLNSAVENKYIYYINVIYKGNMKNLKCLYVNVVRH